MEEREISKEKLKNETGISSATLAKLSKTRMYQWQQFKVYVSILIASPVQFYLMKKILMKIPSFSDLGKKWR